MIRDDQRSRRGDAISSHKQRYCLCGLTLSSVLTSLVRIVNLLLAIFVAKTEELLAVRVFTSAFAFYQLICLGIQWRPEERANPNATLYEFTKSQHETIKMVLAAIVCVTLAICLPYLVYFTGETEWNHAGIGVLLFVFPAILDYRIRRSLKYMLGIRPEIKNDDNDDDKNMDYVLLFLWMGKYFQMPVELGPVITYALMVENGYGPELLLSVPHQEIWIATLVLTIGLILVGVVARFSPGICWISSDNKVQIPVNASEAELSYAGYLAALCDERVVYVAAGDVAKDIPLILRWITYSGLPEAGRWGEALGHGNAETGAELRVEKCFGKSIVYSHLGSIYLQLGDRIFEIQGGYMEETSSTLKILKHAVPVNGCWEII